MANKHRKSLNGKKAGKDTEPKDTKKHDGGAEDEAQKKPRFYRTTPALAMR
jgi:hypothetical protein